MIPDWAPCLRGRMLPALFSEMPFAKKARFVGDPYPTFEHSPWWFWMHSDDCRGHEMGSTHWIYRDARVAPALRGTDCGVVQFDIFTGLAC